MILQVRQLLKLQEQFETSDAARQAQHVGNAGIIAELTASNNKLEAQVSSLTGHLDKAQSKKHLAEESTAAQHAQQAAADAASTENITNLTAANSKLMQQVAHLNARLQQAHTDVVRASKTSSAQGAESDSSAEDHVQLRQQVKSLTLQLDQAQQAAGNAEFMQLN